MYDADFANSLPSRRTLIAGAAWSVPVIASVTATPAFAASTTPPETVVLVWNSLTAAQTAGPRIRASFQVAVASPGQTATASITLYLYERVNANKTTLIATRALDPSTLGPNYTNSFEFTNTLGNGKKYFVTGIATGSLTSWKQGTTTYTGTWTLAPATANSAEVHVN